MKALLYDQSGTKKVDTNFYGVTPGTTVFSKASRDHHVVLAIVSNGPQTAAFTFKNVRSYWSATTAGIPINP